LVPRRSVAVDRLEYRPDGTILPVRRTFMGNALRANVGEAAEEAATFESIAPNVYNSTNDWERLMKVLRGL